jgi:hypothetical protein
MPLYIDRGENLIYRYLPSDPKAGNPPQPRRHIGDALVLIAALAGLAVVVAL